MQPTTKKDAQQHGEKAKDAAHNAYDSAKDAASHAGQAASSLAGQAKDAASNLAGQAKDTASNLAGQAKDAASNLGKKAEDWTAAAGHSVGSLAGSLRQQGPSSGMLGKANEAVAEGIESAGHYLEDKNLSGMMDDVSSLIKRNPIPALLVGLGVGYLLGKAMRS